MVTRLLITLLFLPLAAQASTFYCTPSGSGAHTGSDWNNALTDIPEPQTRGATYVLAAGAYTPMQFTTPVSGTQLRSVGRLWDGFAANLHSFNAISASGIFRPSHENRLTPSDLGISGGLGFGASEGIRTLRSLQSFPQFSARSRPLLKFCGTIVGRFRREFTPFSCFDRAR